MARQSQLCYSPKKLGHFRRHDFYLSHLGPLINVLPIYLTTSPSMWALRYLWLRCTSWDQQLSLYLLAAYLSLPPAVCFLPLRPASNHRGIIFYHFIFHWTTVASITEFLKILIEVEKLFGSFFLGEIIFQSFGTGPVRNFHWKWKLRKRVSYPSPL